MKIDGPAVRQYLKAFDFKTLFREQLGWNNHHARLDVPIGDTIISLTAVSQKGGFVAYVCPTIPDRPTRLRIDHQVAKSTREHFIIYADQKAGQQVWQWVRREPGKPTASRDHRFDVKQSGDALIQRLDQIAVALHEEETINVVEVAGRARAAFDVEKVTKQFYERFKTEHGAFLSFIKGFPAPTKKGKELEQHPDLQWYTSLMLNRLMFVYFIQKKGFLDRDLDYLRNRLKLVQQQQGKDKFNKFYTYFLLRLFHDGLGKAPGERGLDPAMEKLLGKVPYLNGGFFEVHQLEEKYKDIEIADKAFEKLFDFFDLYSWHLDERPLRKDNEINPDVVGYIFEKYINQKQMGAYYTKEDITEYISKSTIIPFLFNAAEKTCAIAFKPDSFIWRLLRDDPDRYIYPAVLHGVIDKAGAVITLPKDIEAGVKDASKRDGWNKSASDPFALPTETWREHVARRTRCLELREKLKTGQVQNINDLITLNLDNWQFARDVIIHCEGPELLRAFWHAIAGKLDKSGVEVERGISVLDPTCGSGAFLFAALVILETLYSDCLERMARFVESLTDKDHKDKFSDFKLALEKIASHPNRERYFILKSIIINNLYGVDIMEEAVEICKLRLFLKLVAQVEKVEQIEPLPDVDFNIRAGNTLVGFATFRHVLQVAESRLGFTDEQVKRLKEDVLAVEVFFRMFRGQQTAHGGAVKARDKQELRRRLEKLDIELDRHLAGDYNIDADAFPTSFAKWRKSHQPFHWFVEFYGIMQGGGFDVIIGNPPYVELKEVTQYKFLDYKCEDCGNLYAVVMERCFSLSTSLGRMGFIVPVSSISTDRYLPLQKMLAKRNLHYSSYDDRPSRLFDGIEHIRLTIHLIGGIPEKPVLCSTRYNKWSAVQRTSLFAGLVYAPSSSVLVDGTLPKLSSPIENEIIKKLRSQKARLSDFLSKSGTAPIFYSRKIGYFLQVLNFEPKVLDGNGQRRPPSEFKELLFKNKSAANLALCCLNSCLFYWFVTVFSDCRHVNKREVEAFPINLTALVESPNRKRLENLAEQLMSDLKANSEHRKMRFKHDSLTVQCFFPNRSKAILDEIDAALSSFCGFTDEEHDFISSYDIKYRIGQQIEEDEEDGE